MSHFDKIEIIWPMSLKFGYITCVKRANVSYAV